MCMDLKDSLQNSENKNQQLEKELNLLKEACKMQEKQDEKLDKFTNENKKLLRQYQGFETMCMKLEQSLQVSENKNQQLENDLSLLKKANKVQDKELDKVINEKKELLIQHKESETMCMELEQSLQVSENKNQHLKNDLSLLKEANKVQDKKVDKLINENKELLAQHKESETMCMELEDSLQVSENKNEQLQNDLNCLKEACKMQEKQAEELENINNDLIENQNEVTKSR